ncbi:unnamed protein product [Lota lota]
MMNSILTERRACLLVELRSIHVSVFDAMTTAMTTAPLSLPPPGMPHRQFVSSSRPCSMPREINGEEEGTGERRAEAKPWQLQSWPSGHMEFSPGQKDDSSNASILQIDTGLDWKPVSQI